MGGVLALRPNLNHLVATLIVALLRYNHTFSFDQQEEKK